jgi:hypothetical protein
MKAANYIINDNATEIMNAFNAVRGTSYTFATVDMASYTESVYLTLTDEIKDESITVRFSGHENSRAGSCDIKFDYSHIVTDVADDEWLEANGVDEWDSVDYRDARFDLNIDAFKSELTRRTK